MAVTVATYGQPPLIGLEGGAEQRLKRWVFKVVGYHKQSNSVIVGPHPSMKASPPQLKLIGHSSGFPLKGLGASRWMTLILWKVSKVIGVHGQPGLHAVSPRPKSMR